MCALQTQLLFNRFSDDPLVFRIVVPIELATVNVRTTLEVRFGEHRNDAQKHLLDALDGAPPFRGLLVHQWVVARGVQNGDADVAIWVDVWVEQRRLKLHLEWG